MDLLEGFPKKFVKEFPEKLLGQFPKELMEEFPETILEQSLEELLEKFRDIPGSIFCGIPVVIHDGFTEETLYEFLEGLPKEGPE